MPLATPSSAPTSVAAERERPSGSIQVQRRTRPLGLWAVVVACELLAVAGAQAGLILAEDRLRLPAGLPPAVDVALADVDGDGLQDLVRVATDEVAILLQTATGEFEPHPLQPSLRFAGADFRAVAIGRLRASTALPDVVVARAGAAPLVLANQGGGQFGPIDLMLPPPPVPVASVLVGDLDQVPPDDVLVLPEQGRPQLLQGQGGGYRDASHLLAAGLFVQAPVGALADVDLDGDLDVVLASGVASAAFVLENRAGFVRQLPLPVSGMHGALCVGDFDGDRRVDVALARSAPLPSSVEFVLNRAGGFVAYSPPTPFPLEAPAVGLRAADVLADGIADLVLLLDDGRVRVALNDGLPTFQFRHLAPLPSPAPRAAFALADLEGDGDVDIVAVGGLRRTSVVRDSVLLGRPGVADWLDTESVGFPIGALLGSGVGAAVDVDGDAELDVVAFSSAGRGIAFRNDGTARFAEATGVLPPLTVRDVKRVVRASLDSRGRDLVVIATAAGGTAQPPGVRLLVAQGGAYVDVTARVPVTFHRGFADVAVVPVLQTAVGPNAADDLIVADTAGNLAVLANSNGAFVEVAGAFVPAVAADPVRVILTGDVDGDRRSDVILVETGVRGGSLQVYLRTGGNVAPLFVAAPSPVVGFGGVVRALAEDFDGDGRLDVLAGMDSNAPTRLLLLAGDGRGGFTDVTATTFTAPLPMRVDALASVTAPAGGRALLVGRDDGGPVMVLRRAGGRYAAAEEQPVHGSTRVLDFVIADFDTDGDDDCVLSVVDAMPALLLGTDLQFASVSVAQPRRTVALRARGPHPAAIAAWLWSPAGSTRLALPDLGVVRLLPPITSLAVFPFGPTRVQDIAFPAPVTAGEPTLPFQLAVFDPRLGGMRLSNLEALTLTRR